MPKVSSLEQNHPVSVVKVKLIKSVWLLPLQSIQSKMVTVQLKKDHGFSGTLLIELSSDNCSTFADGCPLVNLDEDKPVKVLLTNSTGFTQNVDRGCWNGLAYEASPVRVPTFPRESATVQIVNSTGEAKVEYQQKF